MTKNSLLKLLFCNLFFMIETFNASMHGPLGTIFYSFLGMFLMWLFLFITQKIVSFSIKKEIVEDENVALGVMFGFAFLSMAIIIAAAII